MMCDFADRIGDLQTIPYNTCDGEVTDKFWERAVIGYMNDIQMVYETKRIEARNM